jgi:hypothetical protein
MVALTTAYEQAAYAPESVDANTATDAVDTAKN